jgi:hypothetical protein
MMKLRAVGEFRAKIALTETRGVASAALAVEWIAVDFACMSEFGGGV